MGVRQRWQRSGEGVVRRNGRPKGCFGESRFFSSHLRFPGVLSANLKGAEKKRTLQKHPFGRPFPCTTPSPLLCRALNVALQTATWFRASIRNNSGVSCDFVEMITSIVCYRFRLSLDASAPTVVKERVPHIS